MKPSVQTAGLDLASTLPGTLAGSAGPLDSSSLPGVLPASQVWLQAPARGVVGTLDANFIITFLSARDPIRISPDLVLGLPLLTAFPMLGESELLRRFLAVQASQTPSLFDYVFVGLPGIPDGLRMHLTVLPQPDGGLLVYGVPDGRSAMKMLRALNRARQQLYALTAGMLNPVLAVDRSLEVTLINKPAQQMLAGMVSSIQRGQSLIQLDIESGLVPHFQQALAGKKFSTIYTTGGRDSADYYEVYFSPVEDGNGEIIGALALGTDITRLHIWEQELQSWQTRLQELINNMPNAVALYSADQYLLTCNNGYMALMSQLGEGDVMPGTHGSEYLRPATMSLQTQLCEAAMAAGSTAHELGAEIDGVSRWFRLHVAALYENGMHTGFSITWTDITNDVNELAESERLHEELMQRYSQLRQFAFISSHTLKAPLANLQSMGQLLGEDLTGEPLEIAQAMNISIGQLDQAIKDLLSSLNNGTNQTRETTHLMALCRRMQRRYQATLLQMGAQLVFEVPPQTLLPITNEGMEELLNIVITNSIRFADAARPLVITVQASVEHRFHVITVTDNGEGLDLQLHSHALFGMYQRFHREKSGRGLGLYLLKSRLEALNGQVEIVSEPGVGTTMRLFLPVAG